MEGTQILLVDDEPLILTGLRLNLEKEGYQVTPADGGKKALSALRSRRFDVVITDLMMNFVDGIEVLRTVKQKSPETVVIILTGYGNLSSAINALRFEADDYLLKPCDHQKLIFRIKKCLENMEIKKNNTSLQKELINRNRELEQAERELRKVKEDLEEQIRKRTGELVLAKDELEKKTLNLEKMNTALQVLLEKREEDRESLEENIVLNVKKLILPVVGKLKQCGDEDLQGHLLDVLEANLKNIVSPFSSRLSSKSLNLTPVELEIANLIREGKTSKEIAGMRSLSSRTVETHRENIRKKMGLQNSKQNLRTYLLSLK
jgi:DNA-binding NarL/FixJ family response regulator